MKRLLPVLCFIGLAAGLGWFVGHHQAGSAAASTAAASSGGRRVAFYQSPMHPWVKSDHPGKCTICGMDLVPVYADEPALAQTSNAVPDNAAGADGITLSATSVRVAGLRAEPVRRGALRRTLAVSGTVEDDETRHRYISAYTSGRVEKLNVRYVGDTVAAGQPMATLFSPELLVAEGEFLSILRGGDKGSLGPGRDRLHRLGLADAQIDDLARRPGLTPPRETEILAPLGGTVIERNVYEGQYVNYGDRLFTLADFTRMWVQFDVYEQDRAWVKTGQRVELTTDAVPGRVFTGAITFINPNFDPRTRSTQARIEIANPDCALPHRVFARGRVEVGGEGENALLVPRTAVLRTGDAERPAVAYVERANGRYEARRLRLGRAGDDDFEVLDGLKEGERVVTAGNLLLDSQVQLSREVASAEHAP